MAGQDGQGPGQGLCDGESRERGRGSADRGTVKAGKAMKGGRRGRLTWGDNCDVLDAGQWT